MSHLKLKLETIVRCLESRMFYNWEKKRDETMKVRELCCTIVARKHLWTTRRLKKGARTRYTKSNTCCRRERKKRKKFQTINALNHSQHFGFIETSENFPSEKLVLVARWNTSLRVRARSHSRAYIYLSQKSHTHTICRLKNSWTEAWVEKKSYDQFIHKSHT